MIIPPRAGTAFHLSKGDRLKIVDLMGEQVADFFCFMKRDMYDYMSTGRSFDYLGKTQPEPGDILYSSKSRPMVKIVEDTVGSHDLLLAPCARETFKKMNEGEDDEAPEKGCLENLSFAFHRLGIDWDHLPAAFNIFMNVELKDGKLNILPPRSKAGDYIELEAMDDLVVGLTACASPRSNNGTLKPIEYEVTPADENEAPLPLVLENEIESTWRV